MPASIAMPSAVCVNALLIVISVKFTILISSVVCVKLELTSAFTQTADGITILAGISSQDLNFTKTSSGDILYIEVNAGATEETFTEITPSGTETYTEITPSGTETYTEIVR